MADQSQGDSHTLLPFSPHTLCSHKQIQLQQQKSTQVTHNSFEPSPQPFYQPSTLSSLSLFSFEPNEGVDFRCALALLGNICRQQSLDSLWDCTRPLYPDFDSIEIAFILQEFILHPYLITYSSLRATSNQHCCSAPCGNRTAPWGTGLPRTADLLPSRHSGHHQLLTRVHQLRQTPLNPFPEPARLYRR